VAVYAGRKGVIYMSTTGGGTAVTVIHMKSWSLNMPTDKIETTAFGDTNKTYVQGLPDATGDMSGWWDDTSDALYDGSQSTNGVKLYLYPSADAPSKFWSGPAWVDFSIDVDVNGAVEVSASFVANGAWAQA
jgi:hypothetical protein